MVIVMTHTWWILFRICTAVGVRVSIVFWFYSNLIFISIAYWIRRSVEKVWHVRGCHRSQCWIIISGFRIIPLMLLTSSLQLGFHKILHFWKLLLLQNICVALFIQTNIFFNIRRLRGIYVVTPIDFVLDTVLITLQSSIGVTL